MFYTKQTPNYRYLLEHYLSRDRKSSVSRLRPTTSRVLNAMFSMIGPEGVYGLRILELYAGKGSFGFEAINRGAQHVIFVENNKARCERLAKDLERKGFSDRSSIHCADVLKSTDWLKGRFDIIFADPPYTIKPFNDLIVKIENNELLHPNGIVFLEHSSNLNLEQSIGGMGLVTKRKYGDSAISVFNNYKSQLRE